VERGARLEPCLNAVESTGQLVSLGVTSAAFAIVSGSIVVVDNVVYWLEKQGNCQREKPSDEAKPA
jgi:hypothetical protein